MAAINLQQRAEALLAEIQGSAVSSDDVLNSVQLYGWRERTDPDLYTEFGNGYVRCLQHRWKHCRLGGAVDLAIQGSPVRLPDESPFTEGRIRDLALTRLGVGDCNHLAALAVVKASSFCYATAVIVSDHCREDTVRLAETQKREIHVFALLQSQELEFLELDSPIEQVFKAAPDAVILDPYLKVVCKVSKYSETRLKQYVDRYKLRYCVGHICSLRPGDSVEAEEQEADRIAAIARSRLPQVVIRSLFFGADRLYFLQNTVAQRTLQLKETLARLFPGTVWLHSGNEGALAVFMTGTDAKTKSVADRMKELGFPVKRYRVTGKNNVFYRVQCTHAEHMVEFFVQSSLSSVFKDKTSAFTSLIASCVE